jgi:hypothetical protein
MFNVQKIALGLLFLFSVFFIPFVSSAKAEALPDLVVQDVSLSPALFVGENYKMKLNILVKNIGSGPISLDSRISVGASIYDGIVESFIGNYRKDYRTRLDGLISPLQAGESGTFSSYFDATFSQKIAKVVTWVNRVTDGYQGETKEGGVTESNKDNNFLTKNFDVITKELTLSVSNSSRKSDSNVIFYWNTSVKADCIVEYSLNSDLSNSTKINGNISLDDYKPKFNGLTYSHDNIKVYYSTTINTLQSDKDYYYQVTCNNLLNSKEIRSSGIKKLQKYSTVISIDKSLRTSSSMATLYWNTNVVSNCGVYYSLNSDLSDGLSTDNKTVKVDNFNDDGKFYRTVVINNLKADKEYYYRVDCYLNEDITLNHSDIAVVPSGVVLVKAPNKALIDISKITSTSSVIKADEGLISKLKGKILLQVESKGEAYYINPKDSKKYYMSDGSKAYELMRIFGMGISNKDLEKIKNNKSLAKKYSGKIFLQVESKGEAYYIDSNGSANYLKDGKAAYDIMRKLGLGITNENLNKIVEGSL